MKKIKLNLDELRVKSFETSKPKTDKGTIQGFTPPDWTDLITIGVCDSDHTCDYNSCVLACPTLP